MFDIIIDELKKAFAVGGIDYKTYVDAKHLSAYKGGGRAKLVVYPKTVEELEYVYSTTSGAPHTIIANGSNTLISDGGYDGLLVSLKRLCSPIETYGEYVVARAGVNLSAVISSAIASGLSGTEELSGIPASVGGAVYMNAGAFGREIGELVSEITLFDTKTKESYVLQEEDLTPSYRNGGIPNGTIITSVKLKLAYGSGNSAKRKEEILAKRKLLHPTEPSLGSTFKRTSTGIGAGYYIDKAGLKGVRVGGAEISVQHANFIVNKLNGTASDYLTLTEIAETAVKNKFGINLEREIKLIGTE